MTGGIALVMISALIIAQVTKGRALQRLGVIKS